MWRREVPTVYARSTIMYGREYTVFNVSSSLIVIDTVNLASDRENTYGFNIEKLKRGEYKIPKYLREWLEFEVIQARLAK